MRLFGNIEPCHACGHECHCGGVCKKNLPEGKNVCCEKCTCMETASDKTWENEVVYDK